jgi:hypothetical protein
MRTPSSTQITATGSSADTSSMPPGEPLSAVERTQVLPKPARMHPPLQFMCGPLLRYDTVIENVWRGAAMIVTADSGSQYSPPPFLSMSWDPAVSVQSTPTLPTPRTPSTPSSTSFKNKRRPSHSADVQPFDPETLGERAPPLELPDGFDNAPPYTEVTGNANGHMRKPSRTRQDRMISGHEIWVYHGTSGTFTFWRFLIQIPLSNVEMPVKYSINNGAWIEFVVPAIGQNMRWAAHSVNIHNWKRTKFTTNPSSYSATGSAPE